MHAERCLWGGRDQAPLRSVLGLHFRLAPNTTGSGCVDCKWLELRRLPPTDSGVIFYAAAGVGPPRTDIRKSEEKLHLKDSHQTRTGRAQRSARPLRYALLSLQTRLLAVFYALGTG